MEVFTLKDVSFAYAGAQQWTLQKINASLQSSQLVCLAGCSASGKSTLLRQLKPALRPHGVLQGEILFNGRDLSQLSAQEQAAQIGFVQQHPDAQIVNELVRQELSFGLENLGCDRVVMRRRVAEMADYFRLTPLLHRPVSSLSGGQKQLLNLAAVMTLQPRVLLLDEPLAQLDPLAVQDLLDVLVNLCRDWGVSVLIAEHRLDALLPRADRLWVLNKNGSLLDGAPQELAAQLWGSRHSLSAALPAAAQMSLSVQPLISAPPLSVRDGANWLDNFARQNQLHESVEQKEKSAPGEEVLCAREISFRYDKNSADILRSMNMSIKSGQLCMLIGANGSGKSTLLRVLAGLQQPDRGKLSCAVRRVLLPQDPQSLFAADTLAAELRHVCKDEVLIQKVCELCEVKHLLERHPYDFSGGEQQMAAIAKLLVVQPQLLLLDEPGKGLDAAAARRLGRLLQKLCADGLAVVVASHDVEFCAEYADVCAMLFDGSIAVQGSVSEILAGNSFYTTDAHRIAAAHLPQVVRTSELIAACGGAGAAVEDSSDNANNVSGNNDDKAGANNTVPNAVLPQLPAQEHKQRSRGEAWGALLLLAAIAALSLLLWKNGGQQRYVLSSFLLLGGVLAVAAMRFERSRHTARELVCIAVMVTLVVASRAAFFYLPNFKPMLALVIISGLSFGPSAGFTVGAVSMLLSNFLFGQGPWTLWQMMTMGSCGALFGLAKGRQKLPVALIAACGALAAVLIYGVPMNVASVLMFQTELNLQMLLASCLAGLSFDLIHAVATAVFLLLLTRPLLKKIHRVQKKYGIGNF